MRSVYTLRFVFLSFLFSFLYATSALVSTAQYPQKIEKGWLEFQKEMLVSYRSKYQSLQFSDYTSIQRSLDVFLQKKDMGKALRAVRHILFYLGDLPVENASDTIDVSLQKAIEHYRKRNGLEPAGGLDKSFYKNLKRQPMEIVKVIDRNLIRLNQIKSLDGMCIIVNIPAFQSFLIDSVYILSKFDVIVGRKKNPTVVFSAKMNGIVFYPYWYVPDRILQNEILPLIKKNKGYLSKNKMEWYGHGIRQLPGEKNALGKLKFQFPNRYNIYMHDTPNKNLFNENIRAFSHGCIRVKQAEKLAAMILTSREGWSVDELNEAFKNGINKSVQLKYPVDVRMVYLTAFADETGSLQLRNDIYGLD